MRGQIRAEQYLLWKGEELLSKILVVAGSLKYLLQVENGDVSVKSMMINSGQLPRWPESTSSGSLDVLSPGEHEKLKKNPTTSCRVYCQMTARSRPGSARSAAGDAAALPAGGAMLRAAAGGSQRPPLHPSRGRSPREPESPEPPGPAALPSSLLSLLGWEPGAGDGLSCSRGERRFPNPLPEPRGAGRGRDVLPVSSPPTKPGILLANAGGCHGHGGEVGLLLGGV